MRRRFTNLFLFVLLSCLILDGLPSYSRWQDRGKEIIDPFLDITGLWQGTWDLFAPEIDQQNNGIEVRVSLRDSEPVTWRSPDWVAVPWHRRFWKIRETEFFDRIRSDRNEVAWESFARYSRDRLLKSGDIATDDTIESVALWRRWQPVPSPGSHSPSRVYREVFFESPGHVKDP